MSSYHCTGMNEVLKCVGRCMRVQRVMHLLFQLTVDPDTMWVVNSRGTGMLILTRTFKSVNHLLAVSDN